MAKGGYSRQIDTLNGLCDRTSLDPIHIYLRFVRIELQFKNTIMISDEIKFRDRISHYHHHKLKNMISDLNEEKQKKAEAQDLVAKTQDLLSQLSYNSGTVAGSKPSYPYLRYLDCISEDGSGPCDEVKKVLSGISELCSKLEKWLGIKI